MKEKIMEIGGTFLALLLLMGFWFLIYLLLGWATKTLIFTLSGVALTTSQGSALLLLISVFGLVFRITDQQQYKK